MLNCVTNGVGPPMTPHHILLEFHLCLFWSLRSLLKLVQRHITLQTKRTPHLLKVMCLEHPDDALIHRLQQRRGVRRWEDEFDVVMQVLQHLGVGGSVIEDHQDMEGEALRHAIFLQLVHQGSPAVSLENVSPHLTTGIGIPMDRQAGLFITFECTGVLSVVDQDGLELAVSRQVGPQKEGEMVLKCFEARGRLLLSRDVRAFRLVFPLQACFIHIKNLLGVVTPLLDDGLETIWVGSSGVLFSVFSFSRVLYVMEPIVSLKLIKPGLAGYEIVYGAGLLSLQEAVAIHGFLLGVVKGHVKALMLPLIHLHDQHFITIRFLNT